MPKVSNPAIDSVFRTKQGHDTSTLEGYRAAIRSPEKVSIHQLNPGSHLENLTPEDVHYVIGKHLNSGASDSDIQNRLVSFGFGNKLNSDHIQHVLDRAPQHAAGLTASWTLKNATPEQRSSIAERLKFKDVPARFIDDHPEAFSPQTLSRLAQESSQENDPDYPAPVPERTRNSLARHKALPKNDLYRLAKEGVPEALAHSRISSSDISKLIALKTKPFEAGQLLKNPNVNTEHLHAVVDRGDLKAHEVFDFLKHPAADTGLAEKIATKSTLAAHARADAVEHPLFGKAALKDLLSGSASYQTGDDHGKLPVSAARFNPNMDEELLHQAISHPDPRVAAAALKHENSTSGHTEAALKRAKADPKNSGEILYQLSDHEHASPETLKEIMSGPFDATSKKRAQIRLKSEGHYDDPTQVSFGLGTHKLRTARDLAEESPDQKIHKKDLEAKGLSPQALKIQHLQDSKGHIHKDAIQKEIDARSGLHKFGVSESTYGEDNFNGPDNAAYQKKLEEAEQRHLESFSASDYGVNREDFVDHDKAMSKHMEAFNPEDYGVSEKAHTDESGNLDEDTYNEEYQNAEDEHREKFDPSDYADDDDVIDHRKYEEAEQAAADEHMSRFDPSDYDLGGGEDDKDEADLAAQEPNDQRHTHEKSKVFQMNLTSDHARRLKEAGVWDTFKKMNADSQNSSHPASQGNGLGWVRYTERPDGIHMDEIQSDLGQDFVKQAKAQAKGAVESGQATQEQADEALKETEKKYPPEHYKKISEILFGGEHPNDLLHEAFLQHLRNQGKAGTPVHLWQADTKADLAGQDADKDLPVHMQRTYHHVPKKMGYEEGKYGELATQHASNLQGQPTWKMRLRKSLKRARKVLNGLKNRT